jgi:hypothetical protein
MVMTGKKAERVNEVAEQLAHIVGVVLLFSPKGKGC